MAIETKPNSTVTAGNEARHRTSEPMREQSLLAGIASLSEAL